jgi:hypothetical protein
VTTTHGMQVGSRGTPEFVYPFPDFQRLHHAPVAVYHILYLGMGKDMLRLFIQRLKEQPAAGSAAADKAPTVLIFQRPLLAKKLCSARRRHVVLRSAPTCTLADPAEILGDMTIAATQLYYEVFLHYLLHDMVAFGMPEVFVVMWCVTVCRVTCVG